MSNEVLIALITMISALGGSIITIIGNVIVEKITEKRKLKKESFDKRYECYLELITLLQTLTNKNNSANLINLGRVINKIKLIGGNKVVKIACNYYFNLSTHPEKMYLERHQKFQNCLINAIREEMNMGRSYSNKMYFISELRAGKGIKHAMVESEDIQ